jgi:uncharacterized ferredoxin-like protein
MTRVGTLKKPAKKKRVRRFKMAVYDGKKLAQDKLLDIATYCIHSALKAPQITGRVKLEFEVVTGDDLNPFVEAFGLLLPIAGFHAVSLMSYSKAIAAGEPPVLLLIGGNNLRKSELAWNCGACGFETCKDFNQYSSGIKPGLAAEAKGPYCQWKTIDYGMCCDWACAQAWHHNVTNRIEMASGWAARALGYMPECDIIRGLPLGPMQDMFWYSREVITENVPYDVLKQGLMTLYPSHWGVFVGHGRPIIKSGQKWWETPLNRALIPGDLETLEQAKKTIFESLAALRDKVQSQKKEKS